MMDSYYYFTISLINVVLFVALSRWSYGSWPWEARKTWYWTGPEIEYLRDVQETARCKIASLEQRSMQRLVREIRETKNDNAS